jgi:hypothetical protein
MKCLGCAMWGPGSTPESFREAVQEIPEHGTLLTQVYLVVQGLCAGHAISARILNTNARRALEARRAQERHAEAHRPVEAAVCDWEGCNKPAEATVSNPNPRLKPLSLCLEHSSEIVL